VCVCVCVCVCRGCNINTSVTVIVSAVDIVLEFVLMCFKLFRKFVI